MESKRKEMINFWKAVEEYDSRNWKPADPNACKSCGSTDFEITGLHVLLCSGGHSDTISRFWR
jgi:hypothetical protein